MRRQFLPSTPVLDIGGVLGPPDGEPLTLAVLGDSSVAGVGASTAQETLTYGVAGALADRHRVALHALGVSGALLADVVAAQVPRLAALAPDVVLVCVGTNDVTHATPTWMLRRNLERLATGLRESAPGATIVVSGLPACDTARCFAQPLRALLGLRARRLTRLYRAVLEPHGIGVFDVARETRGMFRRRPELFSSDLFHPSSAGYAYLGTVFGRVVRQAVDASG